LAVVNILQRAGLEIRAWRKLRNLREREENDTHSMLVSKSEQRRHLGDINI
jgi:hypothetical protein